MSNPSDTVKEEHKHKWNYVGEFHSSIGIGTEYKKMAKVICNECGSVKDVEVKS